MDASLINLFVFDTVDNFVKSRSFLGEEGISWKKITNVTTLANFESFLSNLKDDEYLAMAVHVFAKDNIAGVRNFKVSNIHKKYPKLPILFISEANASDIKHKMVDHDIEPGHICKYHEIQTDLENEKILALTKAQLLSTDGNYSGSNNLTVDYAIITALFKDEFEQLRKIINFPEEEIIKTKTKDFYVGYLKNDNSKKVVAAIPNATGMVDTSIIASIMLEKFKPKYLLMSGVCGGSEDTALGDIVVAKSVFTFQKGKISDLKTKNEKGELIKLELYDNEKRPVDYAHLYDERGNQVTISVENFEKEIEAIVTLKTNIEDSLKGKVELIEEQINASIKEDHMFENKTINIHIEPMACSTMVINKEGYFEDTIRSVHRKTAAVEMESYGVARACEFANEGKTIPLIFKSVMDKASNKQDSVGGINYKRFAAYTSAKFMEQLFVNNII